MAKVIFLRCALLHKERYCDEWGLYFGGLYPDSILVRRQFDDGKVIDEFFHVERFKIAFPRIYPIWQKYLDDYNGCDPQERIIYEPTFKNRKKPLVVIMNNQEN